ncbi:MAG: hypothetical protein R3Y24_00905 [Eubacteriales bacterium]
MEKTPTERKLELIQNLRNEQNANAGKMRTRANILYGEEGFNLPTKNGVAQSYSNNSESMTMTSSTESVSTFRLRLLCAIFLFVCFFFMDSRDYQIGTFSSDMILNAMNHELTINSIDFMQ